nr:hypothetical protein [Tanacetum cinerariifolium]
MKGKQKNEPRTNDLKLCENQPSNVRVEAQDSVTPSISKNVSIGHGYICNFPSAEHVMDISAGLRDNETVNSAFIPPKDSTNTCLLVLTQRRRTQGNAQPMPLAVEALDYSKISTANSVGNPQYVSNEAIKSMLVQNEAKHLVITFFTHICVYFSKTSELLVCLAPKSAASAGCGRLDEHHGLTFCTQRVEYA